MNFAQLCFAKTGDLLINASLRDSILEGDLGQTKQVSIYRTIR